MASVPDVQMEEWDRKRPRSADGRNGEVKAHQWIKQLDSRLMSS